MTVKELIKKLEEIENKDREVLLTHKGTPTTKRCYDVQELNFKDNNGRIETGYPELTEEMKVFGYTEEDVFEGEPALVLWSNWEIPKE